MATTTPSLFSINIYWGDWDDEYDAFGNVLSGQSPEQVTAYVNKYLSTFEPAVQEAQAKKVQSFLANPATETTVWVGERLCIYQDGPGTPAEKEFQRNFEILSSSAH